MHLGVNTPQIMSETIDGETIIIHLGTGSYYSLQQVGVDIWAAIERGTTEEAIVGEIARRYAAPREEVEAAVRALVADLAAESLVRTSPNGALPNGAPVQSPPDEAIDRPLFVAPKLEKHTDMQDIILLDPVHEVDDRGWPNASEAAVGPGMTGSGD
jgi:Coenzyme PQQ synthesis protein D (PqqD)